MPSQQAVEAVAEAVAAGRRSRQSVAEGDSQVPLFFFFVLQQLVREIAQDFKIPAG